MCGKRSEFSTAAKPRPGLFLGGWSSFNKMVHRMTGWETIRPANGVNGDKGEMPA